jgi:hypothetical protein
MGKPVFSPEEQKSLKALSTVFNPRRSRPTLALIQFDHLYTRQKVVDQLKKEIKHFDHVEIYIEYQDLFSLSRYLKENLPLEVINSDPQTYIVHVLGLENALWTSTDEVPQSLDEQEGDGQNAGLQTVSTGVVEQINYERELLWLFPFSLIIYVDAYLMKEIQSKAGDFLSWITYRYRFKTPTRPEGQDLQSTQASQDEMVKSIAMSLINHFEKDRNLGTHIDVLPKSNFSLFNLGPKEVSPSKNKAILQGKRDADKSERTL